MPSNPFLGVRDTRTKDIIHETPENSNHFFVKNVKFHGFFKKQGILHKNTTVFLVKTTVRKGENGIDRADARNVKRKVQNAELEFSVYPPQGGSTPSRRKLYELPKELSLRGDAEGGDVAISWYNIRQ